MRKLFVILFLLFAVPSYAAPPARVNTYTSGTVIQSQSVTQNEDSIFNYLQAGVDTYSDGTIVNADIHSSANIQSDKLNLTAIAQSVANSGSTTLTGTFAANGTTNSIGNGGSDVLTLNVPGGMTLSAATTWTLTGALSFSGTIADLGTVTTADINGGTMDGVQIGGTTATGELIVNDASDDADGLGSQGTSGQFLQSAGAGANPVFADLDTPAAGSVIVARDDSMGDEVSATTYTKRKEIVVNGAGTYTIKFDIRDKNNGSGDGNARIYRNGSAVGTERTFTSSWQTFSEDISGWSVGDTCELWVKKAVGGDDLWFKNFRLFSNNVFNSMRTDNSSIDGTSVSSPGTTGGSGSGGAGNQYIEMEVNGTIYKVLHDGTL